MYNKKEIVISGTGCALADFLYNKVSFNGSEFEKFISKNPGDGGLSPGKLVFAEELEKFAGRPYRKILQDITGNRNPDSFNVGGPSLVSLIHAAQMLNEDNFRVNFYGIAGNDNTGKRIFEKVRQTPLNIEKYIVKQNHTSPFTDVFSDPDYNSGHGERTFVNNLGVASEYTPGNLDSDFFSSDITCFGGTALVPQIHDDLSNLLRKAKKNNCLTIVNTVFDFRNQKLNPGSPWPLVQSKADFDLIDLLIMDAEEALKISGQPDLTGSAKYFISSGLHSFIITNGANDLMAWSGDGVFKKMDLFQMPVSNKVSEELYLYPGIKGDTTGCGDNFAGGVIASLAWQFKSKKIGQFDLVDALSLGIASGGFCCFFMGGTYLESFPGEKRQKVQEFKTAYLHQLGQ